MSKINKSKNQTSSLVVVPKKPLNEKLPVHISKDRFKKGFFPKEKLLRLFKLLGLFLFFLGGLFQTTVLIYLIWLAIEQLKPVVIVFWSRISSSANTLDIVVILISLWLSWKIVKCAWKIVTVN